MLQTLTHKFPDLGQAMNRVRSHTGWKINLVPELQRRYNHLSLVGKTHTMLHLVKDCLKDVDTERPSAQHICRRLSALKEASQYAQSLKGRGSERKEGEGVVEGGMEGGKWQGETQERDGLIQQLREENQAREREKEREISEKKREVREKETEVREKEREVQNLRVEVRLKKEENETLRGVVQEREREVQVIEEENETLRGVVREGEGGTSERRERNSEGCGSREGEGGTSDRRKERNSEGCGLREGEKDEKSKQIECPGQHLQENIHSISVSCSRHSSLFPPPTLTLSVAQACGHIFF